MWICSFPLAFSLINIFPMHFTYSMRLQWQFILLFDFNWSHTHSPRLRMTKPSSFHTNELNGDSTRRQIDGLTIISMRLYSNGTWKSIIQVWFTAIGGDILENLRHPREMSPVKALELSSIRSSCVWILVLRSSARCLSGEACGLQLP